MSSFAGYNMWKDQKYLTWGDIYTLIFILVMGMVSVITFIVAEIGTWLSDRANRIALQKIDWEEDI
jgi:hypothetical protein